MSSFVQFVLLHLSLKISLHWQWVEVAEHRDMFRSRLGDFSPSRAHSWPTLSWGLFCSRNSEGGISTQLHTCMLSSLYCRYPLSKYVAVVMITVGISLATIASAWQMVWDVYQL